jgi:hypothetical protein
LGWIVPLGGGMRGELYTLAPHSIVGTDPGQCHVVLDDQYMSSVHAEIKAEGGVWVVLAEIGPPFHHPPWRPNLIGLVVDAGTDWDELVELLVDSHRICAGR